MESLIPAPAPLRRPRSPESLRDNGSDRVPPRKFGPPGNAIASAPTTGGPRNAGPRANQNRANQSLDSSRSQDNRSQPDNRARFNRSAEGDIERSNAPSNERNNRDRNQDENRNGRRDQERSDNRNRNQDGDINNRQSRPGYNDRKPQKEDDEDWGPKTAQKPEPKPAVKPKLPVVQKEEPKFKAKAPASEVFKSIVNARQSHEAKASRPMASAADVLPVARKLVPKNCVLDLLPVGATFAVSVDAAADDPEGGWLCLALSKEHEEQYLMLFDPLAAMCEAGEVYEPRPGDLFGYLEPEEGYWYRARCLSPTLAALIDAGRCLALAPGGCRRLPAAAGDIPEFCVRLSCDKLQLGNKAECTVVSKSGGVVSVCVVEQEGGAALGPGAARRWLPAVQAPPEPAPSAQPAGRTATASASEIPLVPRPPVANNSTVLLVDATEPSRVFVRPASRESQAEFDNFICEVAIYGMDENTPRLTELPIAGQTVVARYTDGNHYRALVQRVSTKHKRCLLEYVEYGNVAAVVLDDLCPCPPQFELAKARTLTSLVTLEMKQGAFTEAAADYLNNLKENGPELTLTIPSGDMSGPRGTPVRLTVARSGEDVNRTVDSLSTPEWMKILERGGDVLEVERLLLPAIEYVELPPAGGQLDIVDVNSLEFGVVYGHAHAAPHAQRAYRLADQLAEYCNSELARDPYLPNAEELCIVKCPDRQQWLRAVIIEQIGGPGGREAQVLLLDYGGLSVVPVADIRKMMPEFVRGIPAAAFSLVIKDFPCDPTPEQVARAKRHMQINERGCGSLTATSCTPQSEAYEYVVEAADLIRAIM